MKVRRLALLVAVLVSICPVAPAIAATDCGFGGPTPGWHAIRLDLPQGTSFLTLELGGERSNVTARPVTDDNSWHLVQGIFVVNATTHVLEAYRIDSQGMAPRKVMVRWDGTTYVEQNVTAADVRYEHHATRLRPGLPAGSYYVIGFGSDGGKGLPNEWWSAGVQVDGSHQCSVMGAGETFDFDQTDFQGGTQVHAPGAGHAEQISHTFSTPRGLVVGIMEAQTQVRAASSATLAYQTPTDAGTLTQRLVPFVSSAGEYAFEASYQGVYPGIVVAGVGLDLP